MSADLIGGLVNAGISIAAGLYFLSLGLGLNIPPVAFQGKKLAVIAGSLILLGGLVSAGMALVKG
jgi:ABC-type Na+ efflux pump permease subunit